MATDSQKKTADGLRAIGGFLHPRINTNNVKHIGGLSMKKCVVCKDAIAKKNLCDKCFQKWLKEKLREE